MSKLREDTYTCSIRLPKRLIRRIDQREGSRSEVIRAILEKEFELDRIKAANFKNEKVWTCTCPSCDAYINMATQPSPGTILKCGACDTKLKITGD